ncbi:hypothetical protein FSP39_023847 [Pinctada imbricata]|uniref:RING-type domain-containing protein n=1 Tax=Pinctada imbricata TaxID=66713 RepID=A0AA88Y3Z0_PINIB|nr:hypothetical protein FSP39_023847 [Pinctada imbricata]
MESAPYRFEKLEHHYMYLHQPLQRNSERETIDDTSSMARIVLNEVNGDYEKQQQNIQDEKSNSDSRLIECLIELNSCRSRSRKRLENLYADRSCSRELFEDLYADRLLSRERFEDLYVDRSCSRELLENSFADRSRSKERLEISFTKLSRSKEHLENSFADLKHSREHLENDENLYSSFREHFFNCYADGSRSVERIENLFADTTEDPLKPEDLYDVIIVHHPEDSDKVEEFVSWLELVLESEGLLDIRIQTCDYAGSHTDHVRNLRRIMKKGMRILLFMTSNFPTHYYLLLKEAIHKSILGSKFNGNKDLKEEMERIMQKCLYPIHTEPRRTRFGRYETPTCLDSYQGIDFFEKKKRLAKMKAVNFVREARNDRTALIRLMKQQSNEADKESQKQNQQIHTNRMSETETQYQGSDEPTACKPVETTFMEKTHCQDHSVSTEIENGNMLPGIQGDNDDSPVHLLLSNAMIESKHEDLSTNSRKARAVFVSSASNGQHGINEQNGQIDSVRREIGNHRYIMPIPTPGHYICNPLNNSKMEEKKPRHEKQTLIHDRPIKKITTEEEDNEEEEETDAKSHSQITFHIEDEPSWFPIRLAKSFRCTLELEEIHVHRGCVESLIRSTNKHIHMHGNQRCRNHCHDNHTNNKQHYCQCRQCQNAMRYEATKIIGEKSEDLSQHSSVVEEKSNINEFFDIFLQHYSVDKTLVSFGSALRKQELILFSKCTPGKVGAPDSHLIIPKQMMPDHLFMENLYIVCVLLSYMYLTLTVLCVFLTIRNVTLSYLMKTRNDRMHKYPKKGLCAVQEADGKKTQKKTKSAVVTNAFLMLWCIVKTSCPSKKEKRPEMKLPIVLSMKKILSDEVAASKLYDLFRKYVDGKNTTKLVLHDWISNSRRDIMVYPAYTLQNGNTLDPILERFNTPDPPNRSETMSFELLRLCTLHDFPHRNAPSLVRLTQAGFYYEGNDDEVVCFSCNVRKRNWNVNDDPMAVHRKLSPNCPFINGTGTQNVPVHTYSGNDHRYKVALVQGLSSTPPAVTNPGSSAQHPRTAPPNSYQPLGNNRPVKYPKYADKAARLDTYKSWPTGNAQHPRDMTEAGFYFTGEGDCARCFHCGIGLKNWDPADNAWVEHARWSPRCPYMLEIKGQDFIDLVMDAADRANREAQNQRNNAAQSSERSDPSNSAQNVEKDCTPGPVTQNGSGTTDAGSVTTSTVRDVSQVPRFPLQTPAAQSVISQGYPPKIIKIAMDAIIEKSGWPSVTANTILQELSDSGYSSSSSSSSSSQGASASTGSNAQDKKVLQSENKQLQELTTCKICLDEKVSIVFLPCGHLVSCAQCAPAMRKCPICRTLVKGTVRTCLMDG